MRRAALTALIAAGALTGCGTSVSPPAAGGRTGSTASPSAAGGRTGSTASPSAAGGRTGSTASPSAAGGRTGSGASPSAAGSKTERPPVCYQVIFTENSGNGPTYHVRICDALPKPRPGHEWEMIVDGGRLASRAVIFGQQVPARGPRSARPR